MQITPIRKGGHQGDVVVLRVSNIPQGAKRIPVPDRIILAEGEATGHAHVVNGNAVDSLFEFDGDLYMVMTEEPEEAGIAVHEEHGPGVLIPGETYRAKRNLREYVPGAVPRRVV